MSLCGITPCLNGGGSWSKQALAGTARHISGRPPRDCHRRGRSEAGMTAIVVQADARQLPLPDASVDLVCTSPPYFALRSYTDAGEHYEGQIGSEQTPRQWLEAMWECTREMMRVLKPEGSIWINLGDSFSSGLRFDDGFTAHDAAWLAGVIDCDGSVSIRVDNGGRSHVAWTRVGQMRPEVVERILSVTKVGKVWQDNRGVWNWNAAA